MAQEMDLHDQNHSHLLNRLCQHSWHTLFRLELNWKLYELWKISSKKKTKTDKHPHLSEPSDRCLSQSLQRYYRLSREPSEPKTTRMHSYPIVQLSVENICDTFNGVSTIWLRQTFANKEMRCYHHRSAEAAAAALASTKKAQNETKQAIKCVIGTDPPGRVCCKLFYISRLGTLVHSKSRAEGRYERKRRYLKIGHFGQSSKITPAIAQIRRCSLR